MKISQIKPYEKNAKKHTKKQIMAVAESIQTFGFNQPIVVDKDGVIIVGHARFEAAKLLGLKDVPTITVKLSEEKVKAYRLADNKLNESAWDMKLVVEELKEMSMEMVELTGFSTDLTSESGEGDDVVPVNPPTICKEGDIWQLGAHRLICGDSTKEKTYEKLMAGAKADLVFTDPPYNVNYEGSGKKTSSKIMNDHMSERKFFEFLVESFSGTLTALKKGAGLYVFHSNKTQATFEEALTVAGYDIKAQLIWNKPSAGMGQGDYRTTIVDFQKTPAELLEWAKRQKAAETVGKTTIWSMKREPTQDYVHPTQKPVELISYALFNNTKADDIVLDPFLGSGSTLIACEKTGRVCTGAELDA